MADGWMPYYSRRHTDKELLSMKQHVESLNRPAINNIRAYRLSSAQEGRLLASIAPSPNEARLRSLSAPGHTPKSDYSWSPSPRNTADDTAVENALFHEVRSEKRGRRNRPRNTIDHSRRNNNITNRQSRSAPSRPVGKSQPPVVVVSDSLTSDEDQSCAGITRIPSYLQPTKSSSKKKLPSRERIKYSDIPPQPPPEEEEEATDIIPPALVPKRRQESEQSDDIIPVTTRGSSTYTLPTASSRMKGEEYDRRDRRRKSSSTLRSRSAPHFPPRWEGGIRVPSIGVPARDRNRQVRHIVQLVTDLAATDQKRGPVTQDNGWHIVVASLEKQLREAQMALQQTQMAREEKKVRSSRDIEKRFITQMSSMEVHYEEKLATGEKEMAVVNRLNMDLKREVVELKRLLQQQAKQIAIPSIGKVKQVESVAEAVVLSDTSTELRAILERPLPAVASPVRPYTPDNSDNAAELVPVHLSPRPAVVNDRPQSVTLSPPSVSYQPQSLRSTVMLMTPPPMAPSPVSPWRLARNEQTPLSPNRHYLELVEKSNLADQLVTAKMELNLAKQECSALRSGHAPSPQIPDRRRRFL
eukprot:TRINITY_DN8312_c1_g1_i1.p1 TRINITY_DN8312_c1_g1~~TRINITY_DN8312_c1_g1_i1.p1  ORF type:complete len:584 (+),score=112.39 TRINITY_DN8312_c1_g1_i1:45-1796(+)